MTHEDGDEQLVIKNEIDKPSLSGELSMEDVSPVALPTPEMKRESSDHEASGMGTGSIRQKTTGSKLGKSGKHVKFTSAPQLFLDLPSRTEEALSTFEELRECTYGNRQLGDSGQEEVMTCDCKENIDGSINIACDEMSDCINRMTSMECVDGECSCGDRCRNQRFQRKEYAPVDVIQTQKKGYGLRAKENILLGTFIYEYIGEVIDEVRFRRRMQQYDEQGIKHFYFMMLQKGEFVDATQRGCLARFCNHSCNPNSYVDKWVVKDKLRMGIFAKRDILAGEEITFDYNVDRYGAQAQPCYCGEPNCIGFIGGKTQTEAASKLPQVFVDALGISDDEDWATATSKRKRRIKADDDEEYVSTLPTRAVSEDGVSKIMSGLLQCKEKWLVSKLLKRIQMSDDPGVQRRVMQMHGYQILGSVMREWKAEDDIVILVLEILSKWPRITRNKISSSKIESTVTELTKTSENEEIVSLSKSLISEWQSLEMAYRIPRRERPVKPARQEESTPQPQEKMATNTPKEESTVSTISTPTMPIPTGPKQSKGHFRGTPRSNFKRDRNSQANGTPKLPWGWSSAEDTNGRVYYFNRAENKTQWEFPETDSSNAPLPPLPPPPPSAGSVASATEKLDLQKIIDEANKQLAERATKKDTGDSNFEKESQANNSENHSQRKHRSNGHSESKKSSSESVEHALTKTFAKYVPNIVARYEKEVGHDAVKKYSKDITKILVEKEMRPGHVIKSTSELSDEKKKKIKLFTKTYMDKIIDRKKEKDASKSRT
ncbi:hypothetical protein V1511DRAFT_277238 [Dipodascopsis uninucleata]